MSNRPEENKNKGNSTFLIMGIIFLFTPLAFLGVIFIMIYFFSAGTKSSEDIMSEIKKEMNKMNEEIKGMDKEECKECEDLYEEINQMLEEESMKHDIEKAEQAVMSDSQINDKYFNKGGAIHKNGFDNGNDGPIKYY